MGFRVRLFTLVYKEDSTSFKRFSFPNQVNRNKTKHSQHSNKHSVLNTILARFFQFKMKFAILTAFFPVFIAAASVAKRVETLDAKLSVIDINKIENFSGEASNGEKFAGDVNAVAAPNARWCSFGFWCGDNAPTCCTRACCLPGTAFCGADGNCYRFT